MSGDLNQNSDLYATSAMPDKKLDSISPSLPGEPAYFEYTSSPNLGQSYPPYSYSPPAYLHYPYPPPAYLYQNNTPPSGQSYPVYSFPLPLGTAIKQLPKQYLRILTRPSVATFTQEKQKAAWNIIWVQLAFIAIIEAIVNYISYAFLIPMCFSLLHISKIGGIIDASTYKNQALQGSFQGLISAPMSAFLGWSFIYLLVKAFKGRGTYIEHIYCISLVYVPMLIIGSLLLSFFPLVDLLGSLPLSVYGLFVLIGTISVSVYGFFVMVRMTMTVHSMSAKKASLVLLLISGSVIALVLCGVALLLLMFAFLTAF